MRILIVAVAGVLLLSQVCIAEGPTLPPESFTNLAETRDDLFALATARSTPFIRTMADFDKYVASGRISKLGLSESSMPRV